MKVKRAKHNGRIAVTKHFYLDDFAGDVKPNPVQVQNIFALAQRLEGVGKAPHGRPVVIRALMSAAAQRTAGLTYDGRRTLGLICEYRLPTEPGQPTHRIEL
jgi:hypothetical protein